MGGEGQEVKALLVGGITGVMLGLMWHWSLLRTVNLLVSDSAISITRMLCSMVARISVIGVVLAILLIHGGLYSLLTALLTMMVVRRYVGLLAVRNTVK